jgi:SAM-dependent methyltransferase
MSATSNNSLPSAYDSAFYAAIRDGARRSAATMLPAILDLVRPRSVVDVGCGVGTWLAVAREQGIEDVLGIDGAHVDPAQLLIPRDRFLACNLEQPLVISRSFDLAMSLEVAEHLAPVRARTFVASLTQLAPVVVFSAAVPGQGGVNHVNEQWPIYWVDLFARHEYLAVDALRAQFWPHPDVEWWYAQNVLMFVRQDRLPHYPALESAYARTHPQRLTVLHPKLLEYWTCGPGACVYQDAGSLMRAVPGAVRKAVQRRLHRVR